MKKAVTLLLLFIFLCVAEAHEFWLMPQKFKYEVGEKMILDFKVGEGFEGDYWDMSTNKVEKLSLYNRVTRLDLMTKIKSTKGANLEYAFSNVGTQLIAMESGSALIESTADEFNEYLTEDGLDYIKDERKKRDEEGKSAKEIYTRFARLLLQVGDKTDDTYKKTTGLKLEIVPSQNPYDLKPGDHMECKVLYRGNPEPRALVKVWSHVGNRVFQQNIYTESDGSIRFPISNAGPWMVSSVKMIRSQAANAEWESMWASLVFEIE